MSVDPSSLIFVVIIGIWAVYLVQHWVRRREQLATSRSVDRFSEAMRILERRAPIPVELPVRSNRSYVVASAQKVSAPEISVDRPEVAMKPRTVVPRRTHRLRALLLLTLLVATPVMWAAHVFGTLYTWPAVLVTGMAGLDLMLVRSAVRRASRRRRAGKRAVAARPARAARPVRPARPASDATMAAPLVNAGAPAGLVPAPVHSSVHSQDAVTEVIRLEGEWEPVAVPRPTYTMKAKAEQRPVDPTARLEADSESAPSREPLRPAIDVDELDLDSVLDRRRAAGA